MGCFDKIRCFMIIFLVFYLCKVDLILAKENIKELLKLVLPVIRPRSILIIGSSGSSEKIYKLLYYFNRSSLNDLLMVMGGIESVIISNDMNI